MGVTTTQTNKPFNPRGNDQSPKGYNRAALYSGKALDFDGVNDTINVGQPSYMNISDGAITLACYARLDSTAANGHFFRQENGTQRILFAYQSNIDGLAFGTYDGSVYSELDVAFEPSEKSAITNDVCFIVATQDTDGNRSIYLNGVLIGSDTKAQGLTCNNSADLHIGSNQSTEVWNGLIGNAKIFDVALTASQVADLYNNPEKVVPTGLESNLKLWLPMMEGAGTTAYDGSGNGNHGTISGATYVNGIGAPVAQSAVIDWNKGSNLALYSEQFDNGYWNKNTFQISLTANATTAPDGQTTADKITNTSTGTNPVVYSSAIPITATTDYMVSVYAKSAGKDWICVRDVTDSNPRVWFNLSNGTIGTEITATGTIESVGDGWYRCSVYNNGSSGTTGRAVFLSVDADNSLTGTPSGTDGIYIWGASVEQSATAGPYVRTGATAQTSEVLLPQGLTTGRDITGVNLFENVRKQGALNLDGNSWAEVHENASIDISDCSLEAWVYPLPETIGTWQTIFSKVDQANLQIYLNPSDQLRHYNSTTAETILDSTPFNKNEWNHFILVEDGSDVLTYVNGALQSTKTISLKMDGDGIFFIGAHTTSGADAINAQIAQPRIYNRALTASEIQQNYNAGKNTYTN